MTARQDHTPPSGDDPRPRPPREPDPGDCCGEGCVNCVYDIHEAAMERYRSRLEEWRRRHPGAAG